MLRALTITLALLALPSAAFAHQNVDEARRLYEEAEFEAASAQLDEAEASVSLTRQDLRRLLELRMYLHIATGGQAALRGDLLRLLTLDGGFRAGDEAPPEVAEVLAQLRAEGTGPIAVHARAEVAGSEVRIDASVENDTAELTREVRITARVGESGPTVGSSPLHVSVRSGDTVAYWAEAIGPGSVVLAQHGDASAPLLFPADGQPITGEGGDDATGWIVLGVVVGILVAGGAVTLGVVLGADAGGQSDLTQPTLPMIAMDP